MRRWVLPLCVLLILALATPALALTIPERIAACAARGGSWWRYDVAVGGTCLIPRYPGGGPPWR